MDTAMTSFLLVTASYTPFYPGEKTRTMQTPLNPALVVARVLVALLYIVAGVVKLIYYTGTLGYFMKIGVPLPDVALPLVILIELASGIAVAIGWQLRSSPRCWRRSRCSRPFGHRFWATDPAQFTNQLYNFPKNLAIIGAFIALFLADRKNAPRA